MATLILDIETVGETWNSVDFVTQQSLAGWIDRMERKSNERQALIHEVAESLGLSPFTGHIVAIGLYDVERRQGVVYYHDDTNQQDIDFGDFVLRTRNENDMLTDVWDGALSYDTFVTFNGRAFDVPFLNIRSAIHGIRPSCDLMERRYLSYQKHIRHVDLHDQFSHYGAFSRKTSLHLCCRAFNIPSPKMGGVSGEDVAKLFHAKKFRDIAEYNAHNVIATTALYQKWLTYLAPYSFINGIESI